MGVHEDTLQGLREAIEYAQGDKSKCTVRTVSVVPIQKYSKEDIKRIRTTNKMSQTIFAEVIGVATKTVESWESGYNKPNGTALRMFQLLENNSDEILDKIIVRN